MNDKDVKQQATAGVEEPRLVPHLINPRSRLGSPKRKIPKDIQALATKVRIKLRDPVVRKYVDKLYGKWRRVVDRYLDEGVGRRGGYSELCIDPIGNSDGPFRAFELVGMLAALYDIAFPRSAERFLPQHSKEDWSEPSDEEDAPVLTKEYDRGLWRCLAREILWRSMCNSLDYRPELEEGATGCLSARSLRSRKKRQLSTGQPERKVGISWEQKARPQMSARLRPSRRLGSLSIR